MKSYTSIEQAKKLAEILPLESADMYYTPPLIKGHTDYIPHLKRKLPIDWDIEQATPCWSLAALFRMLPKSAYLEKGSSTELCRVTLPVELISSDWNLEPIDACVEVILKLHKQKLL